MNTKPMVTAESMERMWALANPLNFTRYFFKANGQKRFIVGDHHKTVCDALDRVLRGEVNKLIINIAPRYGKTELAVKNFIAMGLAINPAANFIHLSYSSDLAVDNSVAIKDIVNCEEYQRLFPTRVRHGSDTKAQWDTEQGGGVYATSTLGQITGFGAGEVDRRIFTNSSKVQNMVYYPEGWEERWPQYAAAMKAYRKEGGNDHDDAPDCTTGIVERFGLNSHASLTDDEVARIEDEIY